MNRPSPSRLGRQQILTVPRCVIRPAGQGELALADARRVDAARDIAAAVIAGHRPPKCCLAVVIVFEVSGRVFLPFEAEGGGLVCDRAARSNAVPFPGGFGDQCDRLILLCYKLNLSWYNGFVGTQTAPGLQEKRFAAYMDGLAKAAGHADRVTPLKAYCAGLLLPGERKSVEPMAARLAPDNVRRTHQSLHHLVAEAPWSDQAMLETVRGSVLSRMKENGPVVAWIVDDTGFPKKGTHSVGVARQYCGQVGKPENGRVAVSLSVATHHASLPIAWRLYLPESWAHDGKRRKAVGVPPEIQFQTKPEIALGQIRQAAEQEVATAPVLADSAYGNDTQFREGITQLDLPYVVGLHETTTVWRPGEGPRPKPRLKGKGRPPTRLHRDAEHQPVSVKEVALSLPEPVWKTVRWREGTKQRLRSRFAAVRVRPAHRDQLRHEAYPEE